MNLKILLTTAVVCYLYFFHNIPVLAAGSCWEIMTYGASNTGKWEGDLGIHNVRGGCSGMPGTCLASRLGVNGMYLEYDKVFLGITKGSEYSTNGEADKISTYALLYSDLSRSYPKLYEIDIDDFYDFWIKALDGNNNIKLKEIIDNTKKINPNLKFGITLYEDDLPFVTNITLANRGKINYIHLFLHHRLTNVERDVQTVKTLFPNAKVIAGSYALDFKSPCTVSDSVPCTGQNEINYYNDSLQHQANLMKSCGIESIEFWPAYFGNEEQIDYSACLAKGNLLDVCISRTGAMRRSALNILNSIKPTLIPTLTPTKVPTLTPTKIPTLTPTKVPTLTPTKIPTLTPTKVPTLTPTKVPTLSPTNTPIPSLCTQCPTDFKCYSNGTEYKWFVTGYVMQGFTASTSTTCGGVIKPTYLGKSKGDANCDGKNDVVDFSLWHTEFFNGNKGAVIKNSWNADFTGPQGTCDGKVDVLDYSLWQTFFNRLK